MNFYKRYPGDYMRDTAHLSLAEHGAYTLLMDHIYGTEKPIHNRDAFYRVCRAVTDEEKQAVDSIREGFFTETDHGWVNSRAEQEIEKASKKRKSAQDNGKKGGRPSQRNLNLTEEHTEDEPSGLQEGNPQERNSESSPDTRHHTEQTNIPDSGESGDDDGHVYLTKKRRKLNGQQFGWFHQFWKTFAKPDGKAEAADAWLDLKVSEKLLPDILYGAEQEAVHRADLVDKGLTPKWPQGWLSGRRWEKWVEMRTEKETRRSQAAPVDWEVLGRKLGVHWDPKEYYRDFIERVQAAYQEQKGVASGDAGSTG